MSSTSIIRSLLDAGPMTSLLPQCASPPASSASAIRPRSSGPQSLNQSLNQNNNAQSNNHHLNNNSNDGIGLKAKKKAAFDAWLSNKLQQINSSDQTKSIIDESTIDTNNDRPIDLRSDQSINQQQRAAGVKRSRSMLESTTDTVSSSAASPTPVLQSLIAATPSTSLSAIIQSQKPSPLPPTSARNRASRSNTPNNGNTGKPAVKMTPGVHEVLTAPKLSRHNDAAYYPNIQCILCKEWVCSRNRYMHIESHLQYRPYKCSVCAYDNRKEIFINLHIKKAHAGQAQVLYAPDSDLEHRAWMLAEQCLQHTREILVEESNNGNGCTTAANNAANNKHNNGFMKHQKSAAKRVKSDVSNGRKTENGNAKLETAADSTSSTVNANGSAPGLANGATLESATPLLAPYAQVFRPKIYNTQRIEKSHMIEESRSLGLVPDFSEVVERETKCQICQAYVLSHNNVLEEHARVHMSKPTYVCNLDGCTTEHHSKNFLTRHMKEVHKYRRPPLDRLDLDKELQREFKQMCLTAFPDMFNAQTLDLMMGKHRSRAGRPPGGNLHNAQFNNNHNNNNAAQQQQPTTTKTTPPPIIKPIAQNVAATANALSALQQALLNRATLNNNNNHNNNNIHNNNNMVRNASAPDLSQLLADNTNNNIAATTTPVSSTQPQQQQPARPIPTNPLAVLLQLQQQQQQQQNIQQTLTLTQQQQQQHPTCRLCQLQLNQSDYAAMYAHVKSHLPMSPYVCQICQLAATDIDVVRSHIGQSHPEHQVDKTMLNRMSVDLAQQCNLYMIACFPNVPLQPHKHDPPNAAILSTS